MGNRHRNNLQYFLERWQKLGDDRPALVSQDRTFSWRQLDEMINKVSLSLKSQGVVQSGVVALVSRNDAELLFVYLACVKLGAIPAIIAPGSDLQLGNKFEALGCQHIWFSSRTAIINDFTGYHLLSINYPLLDASDERDMSSGHICPSNNHLENLVSIIFTSGSTGTPKAVAHTDAQHVASAQGLLEQFQFGSDDVWLLSLPMFHVSGLAIVWRWLTVGACLKIGDGKDLNADLEGVTHASLVPTQLKRLLDSGKALSLERVLLGGGQIPLELAQAAKLKGVDTWLGYGMTEAASTVMAKRVDERDGVGYLLLNRTIKIDNQRIYIGGESIASGYFFRGQLTPITKNGWFDSKDLGEWDGLELKILGRADNMFISGGENIHCEEIESTLMKHSDINNVVVIPVLDTEFGARPIAVVQYQHTNGDLADKNTLDSFISNDLEKFKWPIEYVVMPTFLSSGSGIKISRTAVKEWFAQSQSKYVIK